MIRMVFIFGVILPTLLTVAFFIGFLICWFKFNLREKLFKKKGLCKKQSSHGTSTSGRRPTHQIVAYRRDSTDDNDGGEQGGKTSNPGSSTTHNVIANTHAMDSYDRMEDASSVDDSSERALFRSSTDGSMSPGGYSNPNMANYCRARVADTAISEEVENHGGDAGKTTVEHTFCFPASTQLKGVTGETEDSGDYNYGHFIPLSQVLQDEKLRQKYHIEFKEKSFGKCAEMDNIHLLQHHNMSQPIAGV